MLGVHPHMIELLALGATASRCALRLPEPFISDGSPFSLANNRLSSRACILIVLKIRLFRPFAIGLSKGIFIFCK